MLTNDLTKGETDMNPRVLEVLKAQGWDDAHIAKFLQAVRNVAALYDIKYGQYPEHVYEGYEFLRFCGNDKSSDSWMPDPTAPSCRKWEEDLDRLEFHTADNKISELTQNEPPEI